MFNKNLSLVFLKFKETEYTLKIYFEPTPMHFECTLYQQLSNKEDKKQNSSHYF